jgi:osmotically-inducible protein OsmY
MMKKTGLTLAAVTLLALLPVLQGCVPAAIVGGATVGTMAALDRRPTSVQTDDEAIEWKAMQAIPEQYKAASHVNFTSFNRRLLITGEAPSEEARAAIGESARKLQGVREVINELGIGTASSLGSRSTDGYITSKVKARLVDAKEVSANQVKVVTERANVFLMGQLTEQEARVAVQVARTTTDVRKVINVIEVISPEEAKRLDLLAKSSEPKPAPAPAPVENR